MLLSAVVYNDDWELGLPSPQALRRGHLRGLEGGIPRPGGWSGLGTVQGICCVFSYPWGEEGGGDSLEAVESLISHPPFTGGQVLIDINRNSLSLSFVKGTLEHRRHDALSYYKSQSVPLPSSRLGLPLTISSHSQDIRVEITRNTHHTSKPRTLFFLFHFPPFPVASIHTTHIRKYDPKRS